MRWLPVLGIVGCAGTDAVTDDTGDTQLLGEPFPRCAEQAPLKRALYGDLHVHTALSLDANLQGARALPGEAYRFARGETLGIKPYDGDMARRTIRLLRPLDFAAVTDHAELLGVVALCTDPDSEVYEHPECVSFRDNPQLAFLGINGTLAAEQGAVVRPQLCGDGSVCIAADDVVWAEIQAAAEAAYDRSDACTFTSLVGYEWSGNPSAYNLHRNVIFRNDQVPVHPTSYFDASFPEGLWDALERDCIGAPPCDALAIPHNSNLSFGRMFPTEGMTAEKAQRQARFEPLVEIFQHKGDSECWPGSPAADELCGFEKLPYNSLAGTNLDLDADPLPRDFVRDALGQGLAFLEQLGTNPWRYGIIASTDTHLAAPGSVDEDTLLDAPGIDGEASYPGHGGAGQANRDDLPAGLPDNPTLNPGGLAVVWAEENSREAIFRALKRAEAYGTSGPRIELRFFGGWDFDGQECDGDFAQEGYDRGVPMGADLPAGTGLPTFTIRALADAGTAARPGVKLQRVQIVKGWLDPGGGFLVSVFDVAGDEVGDVDLDTCVPDGGGSDTLCAAWTDTLFDPAVPAFWYVRAVEAPSCRWTTRQCNALGVSCPTEDEDVASCCDHRIEATVQERAWSSPIWWTP